MKTDNFFFAAPSANRICARSHSQLQHQSDGYGAPTSSLLHLTPDQQHYTRRQRATTGAAAFSDKDSSVYSGCSGARGKRNRTRTISMKSSAKGVTKRSKTMDYTNYAYNEAVGRLKLMLADSYETPKGSRGAYLRHFNNEDSTDNYSDTLSVVERPIFADISKYLSPNQKSRLATYSAKKSFGPYSTSKENLALPSHYQSTAAATTAPRDYMLAAKPMMSSAALPQATDSVQAPVEIFNFIEKQEDYIEQLEKESKYCRHELTNLLGKVKDVINENEQLTETARSELANMGGKHAAAAAAATSPSTDSDEHLAYSAKKTPLGTPRKKDTSGGASGVKSPRYASAPNIVYEARISELEAELMQAHIDLRRLKTENEELKRKAENAPDPFGSGSVGVGGVASCDVHRKQIEHLQQDKSALEETIRQLQTRLDEAKAQQYNASSKRYVNDLVQMERSQSELEVRHLRDELDRQHERVRELQHEMARRIAEERANAERRYNNQVDQLGGDLSTQWEQAAKMQLDLERQKRYETDLKRDLANRNAQIDELKMELRSNRSTFLADMAQASAEKQSLEQEITSLRLQLDRSAREAKTEASRLNAEISSLRQRLDRGDADLLHSKREVLRLNDEIATLEKELAYGEMKNEIRPTKKDLDKRISEMQEKHAETVNELEEMIQSQKQLMDKLTGECKTLTNKLEDTTLKHKTEISSLQSNVEFLTNRMLNNDRIGKLDNPSTSSYTNHLPSTQASFDYKPPTFGTIDSARSALDDYAKSSPYKYDSILGGKSGGNATSNADILATTAPATTAAASYDLGGKSSYEPVASALSDYAKSPSYNYGGLNDGDNDDDENLKDNIGEGEKQQQQQPQRDSTAPAPSLEAYKSAGSAGTSGSAYDKDYSLGDLPTSASAAVTDPNLAVAGATPSAYNPADYGAYEGYDPQQGYDTSGYDAAAYDQQYGISGSGEQYDYSAADYDQSAYQYEEPSVAVTPAAAPSEPNVAIKSPPPAPQLQSQAQPQPQAPVAPAPTAAAGIGAAARPPAAPAGEGRPQSRAGGGAVGPPAAAGTVGGGKSALSQQSAATASKK